MHYEEFLPLLEQVQARGPEVLASIIASPQQRTDWKNYIDQQINHHGTPNAIRLLLQLVLTQLMPATTPAVNDNDNDNDHDDDNDKGNDAK